MAWNTRWQVQFKSIDSNAYILNIKQSGYSGNVTQLTPAEQPFTTQEDDDDDIFKPIRAQTGYIRVIDQQGGLLKDIMPTSPLQNYVELICDGTIMWQGFISQQAYTQEWIETNDVPTEISVPVNGLLESLKYTSLPLTDFATEANLAKLIYTIFSKLSAPALDTLYIGGEETYTGRWLSYKLKWYVLFNNYTQTNQGVSYTDYASKTGYEILEATCTLFGLTARENKKTIMLSGAEGNRGDYMSAYTWSALNTYSGTGIIPTYYAPMAMMSAFTWKGDDNSVNYMEGLRAVQATLPLYTNALDVIEIPDTEENLDPVLTVDAYYRSGPTGVIIYMQPHEPRGSIAMETYKFRLWRNAFTGTSPNAWPVLVGTSNYDTVKNSTVFNPSLKNFVFNQTQGNEMATGAFPCRWSPDGQNYKSGIFFQFVETGPWSDGTQRNLVESYSIQSRISFTFASGYLRLNFRLSGFWLRYQGLSNPELYYDNEDYGGFFRMIVYIRLGNNYWDGSSWTTSRTHCLLNITEDGKPPQNWDASMGVKQEEGYYIPITSTISGVMQLEITSLIVLNTSDTQYGHRNMILSDFVFEKAQPNNPLVAGRTQNIYRLSIDDNQSEERNLALNFGTNNNNADNAVFLKDSNGNTFETADYQGVMMRPEMNLLNRIKTYYQRHRHSLEAVLSFNHDLPMQRVTHNGNTYVAIAAERRWNDEQTRIKFIDATAFSDTSNNSQSLNIEFEEIDDAESIGGISEEISISPPEPEE